MTPTPILPGQTIGILGGGQLGRMLALAARRMGYRIHVFDPTPDSPAAQVADFQITAPYDDTDAAKRFASAVDVVTFEFENVPAETLAAVEHLKPVRPSPFVLETTRHRLREKDFLREHGFPVAPYRRVATLDDLRRAVSDLGTPCILKTAEFGYDGKGQFKITSADQLEVVWSQFGNRLGVLEGFVGFEKEISIIGARGLNTFEMYRHPFENEHRNHILDVTTYPARVSERVVDRAEDVAQGIAYALDLVGLMCVELFVVGDDVVVNELAPRPHNSGHLTIDAATTCQFEHQLRAVCGLPEGELRVPNKSAAMANLLGDLWQHGEPNWTAALQDPAIKLHLYGKSKPAPARKMGHLTALGAGPADSRERVLEARDRLVARR